jgi:VWFA-related protein
MKRSICLILALATAGLAQQTVPGALETKLAAVSITVSDKKGRALADLNKSELALQYDGQPAEIVSLENGVAAPVVYAVVIDASGSTRDKLKYIHGYALDVLKLVATGKNRGGMIFFSDKVQLVQDVKSVESEAETLENVPTPIGGTALYDAVIIASRGLRKFSRPGDRRIIFILSDGVDNASQASREEALRELASDGVTVFALGLMGHDHEARRGRSALTELATSTGGVLFLSDSPSDGFIAPFREGLASGLRVSFVPPVPPDGKTHALKVSTSRKDARLWAPASYTSAP